MIPRANLGDTGLEVSRLCFGTGPMAPFRFALPPAEGSRLIRTAFEHGVNFVDTAPNYETTPHIAGALKSLTRTEIVICTKTGATTAAGARSAVEECLRALNTGYVDIVLLHGVRSTEGLGNREDALEELCKAKHEGLIRAVGASTHVYTGSAVRGCIDDPRIEVILTYVNKSGIGLIGGPYEEHYELIEAAYQAGKGVLGMKLLGEGYMAAEAEEHLRYGFELPVIHSVDLGFINEAQIEMSAKIIAGEPVPSALREAAKFGVESEWATNFPTLYR